MGAERQENGIGPNSLDVVHARLATRQEGVVGRLQLVAIGVDRGVITRRLNRRVYSAVHRGVYAVGHEALSFRARCIAALLAVGDDAALSHMTAAFLRRLTATEPPVIDVTTTGRRPRDRKGIRIHEAAVRTSRHEGLLVTTPEQTLHDLRHHEEIERLTSEALYLHLIDRATAPGAAPTRSELERAMRRLVRAARLPQPICQHPIGPYTADFYWPDNQLVAETDGYDGHGHRSAFEHDRARDAWLLANGYVVIRFTWAQITHEPSVVIARLAAVLARTAHLAAPPTSR